MATDIICVFCKCERIDNYLERKIFFVAVGLPRGSDLASEREQGRPGSPYMDSGF